MLPIIYIQNKNINKQKWDFCINKALNTLIYAHSFYLDNCTNSTWDALVYGDYEVVMPIIHRKKYGIKYLYQPTFLQQAGIFSAEVITKTIVHDFIATLEKKFRFAEINLNYSNAFVEINKITLTKKTNYLLQLNDTFEEISKKFKTNFNKNAKRSFANNLQYENTTDYASGIDLYKTLYNNRFNNVTNEDYNTLRLNCAHLQKKGNLIIRNILHEEIIIATIILLKDVNRVYNVASSVTEAGKKLKANYFLFYMLIKELSGSKLILDFEGSDITGIANFYLSMGPNSENYFALKFNNLPRLLKLVKK